MEPIRWGLQFFAVWGCGRAGYPRPARPRCLLEPWYTSRCRGAGRAVSALVPSPGRVSRPIWSARRRLTGRVVAADVGRWRASGHGRASPWPDSGVCQGTPGFLRRQRRPRLSSTRPALLPGGVLAVTVAQVPRFRYACPGRAVRPVGLPPCRCVAWCCPLPCPAPVVGAWLRPASPRRLVEALAAFGHSVRFEAGTHGALQSITDG